MKKYTLSKNGDELGPYSLSEVMALITNREIELFDYVFEESKGDWVLLTEHQEITAALKSQKPKAPPKRQATESTEKDVKPVVHQARQQQQDKKVSAVHDVDWYVMKGESQFGPFGSAELLRLMQEKTVFEFDFVWNSSMKDWKRLAEIADFSKEKIQTLSKDPGAQESFLKRQHKRVPLNSKVIVHDHNQVWIAEGKEISEGGMGLFIKNSMIVPGQILYFHVKGEGNRPSFNVKGEIVSKQFVGGVRIQSKKIEYGVRFLKEEKSAPVQKVG